MQEKQFSKWITDLVVINSFSNGILDVFIFIYMNSTAKTRIKKIFVAKSKQKNVDSTSTNTTMNSEKL